MPRKPNVKTSYQAARTTPSKRKPKKAPDARVPKGLSPLAQYVEDNLDTGISISELIHQFQEYDCPHTKWEVTSVGVTTITERCTECRMLKNKMKPGYTKDG